jgi:hypothetical protein
MESVEYLKLNKKILNCDNLEELKDIVQEVNKFVKDKNIKSSSDEFKKLQERINIVALKLKNKQKLRKEQRTIIVTEQQLSRIVKLISETDSTSQDIIDRILDQISQHGEESLTPKQQKYLKDFGAGKSLEYDKPKFRDRPGVNFESQEEPTVSFTLMETIETDEGHEYLGDVEFQGNEYTGFITADENENLISIEFENLETQKDLLEDAGSNVQHIVSFFEGVVMGLADEDNPYD